MQYHFTIVLSDLNLNSQVLQNVTIVIQLQTTGKKIRSMTFFHWTKWTSDLTKHWIFGIQFQITDTQVFALISLIQQFYFRLCFDPLLQWTLLHLSEQFMYHLHTLECVNLWFNKLCESPTAELEKWGWVFVID